MTSRSVRRLSLLLAAVLVIAALVPAGASAQNVGPTDEQYENGVLGLAGGGSGSEPASASSSELPFTGLDALAIAGVGIVLIGTGFAVRRASRMRGGSGLSS